MKPPADGIWMLHFSVAGARCALPLPQLREILRPLPCRPLAGMPDFIEGVAMIRGAATPVVSAAQLLCSVARPAGRYLLLQAGPLPVALAVDEVEGIRQLPSLTVSQLPPLLRGLSHDAVARLETLDGGLLMVLDGGRLIPPEVWSSLQEAAGR